MLLFDLIRYGEFKVPVSLKKRPLFITYTRGKRNGSSYIINFIDSKTEKVLWSIELPEQYFRSLVSDYLMVCLKELGFGTHTTGLLQLKNELLSFKESEYTSNEEYQAHPNEDDDIDRPQQIRAGIAVPEGGAVGIALDNINANVVYQYYAHRPAAEAQVNLPDNRARRPRGGAVPPRWEDIARNDEQRQADVREPEE